MKLQTARRNRVACTALALAFGLTTCGAAAQAAGRPLPTASYAKVGGATLMPYGWHDFCGRRPKECNVPRLPSHNVRLTQKTWAELNQINSYVNRLIIPVSNVDEWGTTLDHWDYPVNNEGDCKVYALEKRKILLEKGFPRQALLMTIVFDLHNEGHTILTVVTDHGDFVLDNLSRQIKPWDATGYRYVKRQSQHDPNTWLDLSSQRGSGLRIAADK